MNPVKIVKLMMAYRKFESIENEKGTFMNKLPQYLTLAVSLIGTLGVPTLAHNWLSQPSHTIIYTILVGVAIVLHAIFPSIFSAPSDADKSATGLGHMGLILAVLVGVGLLFASPVQAQTASASGLQNFYAAGVSYNVGGSPAVAGTGLYAHQLNGAGTYAFTALDVLPNTKKPLTVNTNVGIGIAQKVATIGNIPIYVPAATGISWSGTNTGWQWNGGALAMFKVKGNYYIAPSVRFMKSSVSNGTGYQPIIGMLFGWGK
jgi:hypothetical protein